MNFEGLTVCPFKIGDRVEKDQLSGMIIAKYLSGNGWLLKVRLLDGKSVSWDSNQVRHCAIEPGEDG